MTNLKSNKWQGALFLSIILHIILIGMFFFGLPSIFEKLPIKKEALTFEILPLSEIANIKNEEKSVKKTEESEKSREIKKSQPKPEPKKNNLQTQEKPKKQLEQEIAKKQITKEPPKVQKTTPQKPTPKKDDDAIDAILKNLEKNSKGNNSQTSKKNSKTQEASDKNSQGVEYDENSPLSITEKLLVKNTIQKNWRPPIGAKELAKVKILFHITVEKNGLIKEVITKKRICPIGTENTCILIEESAKRAVLSSSPLENMLPERYDNWNSFDLLFDPSLLAQ